MTRGRVVLIAACAAFAVLVSAPAGLGGGAAPTCRASQLRGKLFQEEGAAGTIALSVTVRNVGPSCSMRGYAGLRLANGTRLLRTHVYHGGFPRLTRPVRTVLVAHLGRATILMAYSDVTVGNEGRCADGNAILIRPPGQTHWLRVAVPTTACGHGSIRESPVLLGAVKIG